MTEHDKEAHEEIPDLKAVMPDHKRRAAEILADFDRQHRIPEEMRAVWLRRCVEEQLWFVAETAKSFGEQEGYERALATDPLRRMLGSKAVSALLAGEAAVIKLDPMDINARPVAVSYSDGDEYAIESVRLDTHSEAA